MACVPVNVCPNAPETDPRLAKKLQAPEVYLIRTTSGNLKWPSLNIYGSFEEDCKEFNVIGSEGALSSGVVTENLEFILKKRIGTHEQDAFQLGQIFFENHRYKQAYQYLKLSLEKYNDPRAKYQLAVMIYDNLMDKSDRVIYTNPEQTAVAMMDDLMSIERGPGAAKGNDELYNAAALNLFQAYAQGWGVRQCSEQALIYLLKAAESGETKISVLAQTTLGYFYTSPDHFDLQKSFYWHSEACGNGSVESQAVIGVMYMYGLSVEKDWCAALQCLKESAQRGSIYGKGVLSLLYFQRKMFTVAANTASTLALDNGLRTEVMKRPDLNVFPRRGIAIACFIYACCLDRGLGVQKDVNIARGLYKMSFEVDEELCCRFQNMVIRDEI